MSQLDRCLAPNAAFIELGSEEREQVFVTFS
jgi:hypothetical protein